MLSHGRHPVNQVKSEVDTDFANVSSDICPGLTKGENIIPYF